MNKYIIQSGDYVVELSDDSMQYHKKTENDIPTFVFPPSKGITNSLQEIKPKLENLNIDIYQLLDNCSKEQRLNIINYCIDKELNKRKIVPQQLAELKENIQLLRNHWYIKESFSKEISTQTYLKTVLLKNLIKEIFISLESLTMPGMEKAQEKIEKIILHMNKLIDKIQSTIQKQYQLSIANYQENNYIKENDLQNIQIQNFFDDIIKEIDKIIENRNIWDNEDEKKTITFEDKIIVHAHESALALNEYEPPVSESSIDESLLKDIPYERDLSKDDNIFHNDEDSIDAIFNSSFKEIPKEIPKEKIMEEHIEEIKKPTKIIQKNNPLNEILEDGYKACTVEVDEKGRLIPANKELLRIRNTRAMNIFNEKDKFLTEENLVDKAFVLQTDKERIIHALYDIKIAKTILDLSYVPTQTIQAFPFIKEKYDNKYFKLFNEIKNKT